VDAATQRPQARGRMVRTSSPGADRRGTRASANFLRITMPTGAGVGQDAACFSNRCSPISNIRPCA
jgi:hypothetical protein